MTDTDTDVSSEADADTTSRRGLLAGLAVAPAGSAAEIILAVHPTAAPRQLPERSVEPADCRRGTS